MAITKNQLKQAVRNNAPVGQIYDKVISDEVDINFQGVLSGADGIIRTRQAVHNNRILFWLASKPCSYVREGAKGGKLYEMLGGGPMTVEKCAAIRVRLEAAFKEEFEDVELIYLDVSLRPTERTIVVDMWCRDLLYGKNFEVNAEVEESEYEGW